MFEPKIKDLYLAYSILGIKQWAKADNADRKAAEHCLSPSGIASDSWEVSEVWNKEGFSKLVPVPFGKKRKLYPAFFAPILNPDGQDPFPLHLEIFVLHSPSKEGLAFRMEGAHREGQAQTSAHRYAHVQLNFNMKRLGVAALRGIPPVVEHFDSYPAFPMPYWSRVGADEARGEKAAVRSFLGMLVAVHGGHENGADAVLEMMFENQPEARKHYAGVLADMLTP